MAWELSITSAPRGLNPACSGFCPVAQTRGMPPHLIERLEKISGYRHLEIGTGGESRNPVVYSHTLLRLGPETFQVLSRICDAGRDYSGRSNRFAYHLVLKPQELVPAGPAALLQTPGLILDKWDGQLRVIPTEKVIPKITAEPRPCLTWEKVLGDAGWAGVLAQRFVQDPQKTIYFLYPLEIDLLKLLHEVIALLPESLRWKVTFSTYDQGLGETVTCRWRGVPENGPGFATIVNQRGLEVWDLRAKRGPAPATGEANAAREGRLIELPAPIKVSVPVPEVPSPQVVSAPPPSPHEPAYLELADSVDSPPPLWVASRRAVPERRKRRLPVGLIKSVATLMAGVVVGLGLGFVLWSGVLMPPSLPGFVANSTEGEPDQVPEVIGKKPASEKGVRGDKQKPPEAKASGGPAEANKAKKEEQAVPDGFKEVPQQAKPSGPPASETPKPDQAMPEPPAEKSSDGDAASRGAAPESGERSEVTSGGFSEQSGAASEGEPVAAPIGELTLSEIIEIFFEPSPVGMPGVKNAGSWKTRPLWSAPTPQPARDSFALLKMVDRNSQARYYVRSMESLRKMTVRLGQETDVRIPLLEGMTPEVRCVGGWTKGQAHSEFVFRIDGKDRATLKIERKAANITVGVNEIKQGDGPPLPNDLTAQLGFYVDDGSKRVWVPIVELQIRSDAQGQPGQDKQSRGGNR